MKPSALLLLAFAALVLPASARTDGAAVYRPGLTQARISVGSPYGFPVAYTGVPVLASNLLDHIESDRIDRTLDVFKDGQNANLEPNPLSGLTWPWDVDHCVYAYEGEFFVEEGTTYVFFGRFIFGEALVVDGETVVYQGTMSGWNVNPAIWRSWKAPKTGWVPFNGWLWTTGGEGSPCSSKWGLQYNTTGALDDFTNTNVWNRFVDPGNASFFRTVTGKKYTTVGDSAPAADGRSFDLSFTDVPTNAQLVAFSGPVDGIHATNGWRDVSVVLAEVQPGTSTTNIIVPLAADATVLRFRLAHFDAASTNGLDVFEEWTEMQPVTAAPVIRLDTVSPGWTNVVVTGSLGSFGIGGENATATVEVAENDGGAFGRVVASNVLETATSVGAFEAGVFGLSTNTAYFVRMRAVNDRNETGFSATIPFSTLDPGPPSTSIAATVCAFRSATLRATVSDWGGGSWSAEAWIDVSEEADFPAGATQTLGLGVLSGAVPAMASATAVELRSDTNHFARVRVTNSWGVAFVSETKEFRTSNLPVDFPEPTATAEKGRVSVSLAPMFVEPGTVYGVELYAQGPGYEGTWKTWNSENDDPPFEWSRVSAPGADVLIRYTIDWRFPDTGATGQIVRATTTAAKPADRTVDSLSELESLYLRPGDTVEILTTAPGNIFIPNTNDVSTLSRVGSSWVVTANEPGTTFFYEADSAGVTNNVTGIAVVLPSEDPPGGLFIHRGKPYEDWTWTDPTQWERVSGEGDYPNGVGVMAYVYMPSMIQVKSDPNKDADHYIQVHEPVTLGWLAVGQHGQRHYAYKDKTYNQVFQDKLGLGGSFRFETGDGSTSWIRLLGHSFVTAPVKFDVPVTLANDLDLDALNRVPDSAGQRDYRDYGVKYRKTLDVGPHTFRTTRIPYWMPPNHGQQPWGFISFTGDVAGSGTIRLEGNATGGLVGLESGMIPFGPDYFKSFTGHLDVANGEEFSSATAGMHLGWGYFGNARELSVRGNWHAADATTRPGAFVRTGSDYSSMIGAWTNDWRGMMPRKVTLDGGKLKLETNYYLEGDAYSAYERTGIRQNLFQIGEFEINEGPMGTFQSCFNTRGNNTSPNTRVEITNLVVHAGSIAAFALDTTRTMGSGYPNLTNECFVIEPPPMTDADPDTGAQFLPYFFVNDEADNNNQLVFRDSETGKLSKRTAGTGDTDAYRRWTASSTLADNGEWHSMQLAANVTNSFEADATVFNVAGYLDMRNGAALGRPGEDMGATVDFGNQPARIYVGKRADTATIGCKLRGSAGFVKGGSGILALGASAEGVAGSVRIAGGTLALGARDGEGKIAPGRVAGDVVVEAGSRLVVRDKASFAPGVRLFLNDRDWIPSYAHVRLESDASAARLFVCGEPMPNGYYGSSEAALVHSDINVDDVHFEGPGVLWAGVRPTMMILR